MRTLFLIAVLFVAISAGAQTPSALYFSDYPQRSSWGNSNLFPDNRSGKKWSLDKYSGISTGYYFWNGMGSSFVSVPVGLQLNRMMNKNLFAFAGIAAVPTAMSFNHTFMSSGLNKMYPGNGLFSTNSLGLYSRAEMGLMYINDAKTFSISGSISVQRGSYPLIPYSTPANTSGKNAPY